MRAGGQPSSPIRFSYALAAWTIAVSAITILVWLRPHSHTVYTIYVEAGRHWLQGLSAYAAQTPDVYRYGPVDTVLFAMFGLLPDAIGGILWRWLGVALMIGGFAYACRTFYPHWSRTTATERQWLWLLILPLSIASLHNGQANLHMLGLLLIAVSAVPSGRWNLASVCLAAACFLKLYPISLAMLLIAIFPLRLGPRFALALVVGAALPFLAQSPGFVLDEYRAWLGVLAADERLPGTSSAYRDVTQLLHNAHVSITHAQFLIVQVATGLLAAVLCLIARWRLRWAADRLAPFAYALGTFWMLLFGPATESSTYVLIAPLAAWLVVDAIHGRMSRTSAILVLVGSGLVHAALVSSFFPFGRAVHDSGLQPLGVLLIAGGYLFDRLRPESTDA
jgi:Glycosyltransferase family 87